MSEFGPETRRVYPYGRLADEISVHMPQTTIVNSFTVCGDEGWDMPANHAAERPLWDYLEHPRILNR